MTFLPIVGRELRVAARRRSTYWVRTSGALAILVLGTWVFLMMEQRAPAELASVLFGLLTGAAVLYCLLSGVRATSDCISQEKREGTLGLLFLTDLKGYDVVCGKLAANSINVLYAVLASVPMLAIPLLMGGVTAGEFGRMALLALDTLFLSLAVGICVSALHRDGRKASGTTFLVLVLLTGGCPAFAAWMSWGLKHPGIGKLFFLPSAGFGFYQAFSTPYRATPEAYWSCLATIHVMAWSALLLASLVTPRSWQDRPAGVQKLKWRERLKSWSYGDHESRAAYRRTLLGVNPFFWLAARVRSRPATVWAMLGLLGAGWVWGLVEVGNDWLNEGIYVTTGLVLNILLKGWFASECGRQLIEDRQHGALELLMSTPLSVRDILRGQWLALQRQFLGPVLFVLSIQFTFMLAVRAVENNEQSRTVWTILWLASMFMLVADLVALYWVGLWQAMVARNPRRAASGTLSRVIVIPWLAFAGVILLISIGGMNSGGADVSGGFLIFLWVVCGLVADIGFGATARQNLLTQFRTVAALKYEQTPRFWKAFITGR